MKHKLDKSTILFVISICVAFIAGYFMSKLNPTTSHIKPGACVISYDTGFIWKITSVDNNNSTVSGYFKCGWGNDINANFINIKSEDYAPIKCPVVCPLCCEQTKEIN